MNKTMTKRITLLLIASAALVLTLTVQAQSVDGLEKKLKTSPNGIWIVQLEDAPTVRFEGDVIESVTVDGRSVTKALAATAPSVTGAAKMDVNSDAVKRYVNHLDGVRAQVLSQAESQMGRVLQPRHVYRHVLNGFAVKLSESEARQMEQMPGVKSVERDYIEFLQTDAGPEWIGATRYWVGSGGVPNPNRGEGMVLGVIDTGINWESVFLDNSGDFGSPVINPRPNFLGLCSEPEVECSGKLIGVYDFTDEGTKGQDPDAHGSHVATTALGIPLNFSLTAAGGSSISFSTSGVAPRASLISYKACVDNPDGENFICRFADTSAALEQAIEDSVDVINYSIGGSPFDPWLASFSSGIPTSSAVFLNVRAAGIVPVVAAGNDGPADTTVGSPANSPWVLAAANATHDRILANQLVGTSGGSTTLGPLTGLGSSGGTTTLPIVHAKDFGNALCGVGTAELGPTCASNTGATNPFAPGTFNGRIVVCDRGVYGRIEKGRNVFAAGAAGMILANTQEQGESINDDQHCLPATHVGADDGDRLRDWLDGGSNHAGRLSGTTRVVDSRFGGRINDSSSRGPSLGAADVMKPNATAPGTDILAAGQDGPNSIVFLTGTSMASPHIAGAALLLRSSHPTWGVDQVISALETTADASIVRQANDSPARIIDRGAGGIQVDRAARIGLYLPTTISEFRNANPNLGGVPGDLNLPGIVSDNCLGECNFTRRVRALGNSTWTVTTEGDLDIEATPASFTLMAGQEQTISVTIRPGMADIGGWGSGSVVLQSSNNQFVTQRLPVGALVSGGIVPERQSFTSASNRGRGTLLIDDAVSFPEAIYRTSALVRPVRRSPSLPQDPTNDDPYDGGVGVSTEIVAVPANTLLLHAETFTSASIDVDLFVGQDLNGNNQPDDFEEVCSSTTAIDLERCFIEQPEAGNWWIVVQNWNDSAPGRSDTTPFEYAVLTESIEPSLIVSGIANHPGGDLELPVYWDQPAMLRNERWLGAIGIASSPDFAANVGTVLTTVTRTGINTPQIMPLFEGRTETLVIPPSTTHDAAFIDVPPTATRFTATINGDLEDVSVALFPLDQVAGAALPLSELILPPIGVPPNDPVISIEQTGDTWEVELVPNDLLPSNGGLLPAARYYLELQNGSASESLVTVSVNVDEQSRTEAQRGLWNPRDRLINQGFELQVGPPNNIFVTWYSYTEDGSSTFYVSDAFPPQADSSYFQALLYRVTSNGVRQTVDPVGRIQVTGLGEGAETGLVSYAWQLNGHHGAELFIPAHGPICPILDGQPTQLLGHWFPSGVTEGGASVLSTNFTEDWVRYYFDDSGQPRWLYAAGQLPSTLSTSLTLDLLDFRGWCIYCEETDVINTSVGTLERTFQGTSTILEALNFQIGAPISTNYSRERTFQRLSNPQTCPN